MNVASGWARALDESVLWLKTTKLLPSLRPAFSPRVTDVWRPNPRMAAWNMAVSESTSLVTLSWPASQWAETDEAEGEADGSGQR